MDADTADILPNILFFSVLEDVRQFGRPQIAERTGDIRKRFSKENRVCGVNRSKSMHAGTADILPNILFFPFWRTFVSLDDGR
jgi:hypothetical protein